MGWLARFDSANPTFTSISSPPPLFCIYDTLHAARLTGKTRWNRQDKCIREAKKRMRRRKNTLRLVNQLGNLIHFYSPPSHPILLPLCCFLFYIFLGVLFLHPLRSTRKKKPHALTFLRHGQRRRNMTTGQTRIAFVCESLWKNPSVVPESGDQVDGWRPANNEWSVARLASRSFGYFFNSRRQPELRDAHLVLQFEMTTGTSLGDQQQVVK